MVSDYKSDYRLERMVESFERNCRKSDSVFSPSDRDYQQLDSTSLQLLIKDSINSLGIVEIPVQVLFEYAEFYSEHDFFVKFGCNKVNTTKGILSYNAERNNWYISQDEKSGDSYPNRFGHKYSWTLDSSVRAIFYKNEHVDIGLIRPGRAVKFSLNGGSVLNGIISVDEDGDFYICNDVGLQDYDINLSNGDKMNCSHSLFIGDAREDSLIKSHVKILKII